MVYNKNIIDMTLYYKMDHLPTNSQLPNFVNLKQIREIFENNELTENQCIWRSEFICHMCNEWCGFEFKSWDDFIRLTNYFNQHHVTFLWEKNFQQTINNFQRTNKSSKKLIKSRSRKIKLKKENINNIC